MLLFPKGFVLSNCLFQVYNRVYNRRMKILTRKGPAMDRTKAALSIFMLYCQWLLLLSGIYLVGWVLPVAGRLQGFLFAGVTLGVIGFGFWQSAAFLVGPNSRLNAFPAIRGAGLIVCLLFAGLFYLAGQVPQIPRPVIWIAHTANLFVFANLLGAWLVKPLRRAPELIVLCVVLALSDLFSVLSGPTRAIVREIKNYYEGGAQGPAPLGDFLLIKVPVPGNPALQPIFGVSDWIVIVFLSAAAYKLGINDNLVGKGLPAADAGKQPGVYLPAAGPGLLIAMAAAQLLGLFIPALPLVALGYMGYILIVDATARKFKKQDWRLIAGFSAAMGGLLGLGLLYL